MDLVMDFISKDLPSMPFSLRWEHRSQQVKPHERLQPGLHRGNEASTVFSEASSPSDKSMPWISPAPDRSDGRSED